MIDIDEFADSILKYIEDLEEKIDSRKDLNDYSDEAMALDNKIETGEKVIKAQTVKLYILKAMQG